MSARVHTVQKSQKDQGKCSRCGKELPKGTGYRWYTLGFRSSRKTKRCLSSDCYPRMSELTTSKAATIYAAQESFEDQIDSLFTKDDITQAVADVMVAIEEVRDEYQDALDQWEYGNEALQEKVDWYTDQIDNIDGWEPDGPDDWDRCDAHDEDDPELDADGQPVDCEDCEASYAEWINDLRSEAIDKVAEVETM